MWKHKLCDNPSGAYIMALRTAQMYSGAEARVAVTNWPPTLGYSPRLTRNTLLNLLMPF